MNNLCLLILILLFFMDKEPTAQAPINKYSRIAFYIKDIKNIPIESACISIKDICSAKECKLYSDSTGYCCCYLINNEQYQISISKSSYLNIKLNLTPYKNCEYNIQLIRCFQNRLYGFISDSDKKAIVQALVLLYEVTGINTYIPKHFTYTDNIGEYNFFNIPYGTYIIKSIK